MYSPLGVGGGLEGGGEIGLGQAKTKILTYITPFTGLFTPK